MEPRAGSRYGAMPEATGPPRLITGVVAVEFGSGKSDTAI